MIDLKEHNVRFLDEITETFKCHNRVAYISATGTGKSYVTAAYIERNLKEKDKVLIVSPRVALLDQWKLLLKDRENVTYITYCGLHTFNKMYNETFYRMSQFKLIVLDEIHHLGAKLWGALIKSIMNHTGLVKTGTKYLGLSADAYRYDLLRDISIEFFDITVDGYDLQKAIEVGILPKYKYVVVMYDLNESIKTLKAKLTGKKRLRLEEADRVLIDKLDLDAGEYDINEIVSTNLPVEKGLTNRIIVFVDKIDYIDSEYNRFDKLFPNAPKYIAHSKMKRADVERNINEFNNCSEDLCFIFSVNMLNEGIHLDDITAIIMLRKTESVTLYMQQLGRIMSSGCKHTPVVFDFVSNYNIIGKYSILYNENETDRSRVYVRQESTYQFIIDYKTLEIVEIMTTIRSYTEDHYWKQWQIDILMEHYEKDGPALCAKLTGKSIPACKLKANRIGLVYRVYWEQWQIDILKNRYEKDGPVLCAQLTGKPKKSCEYKAHELGLTRPTTRWKQWQVDIIKNRYEKDGPALCAELTGKSITACINKACTLGIRTSKVIGGKEYWKQWQVDIIKNRYEKDGPALCAELTGKSITSCMAKARRMKLIYLPRWEQWQIDILMEHYEKDGPALCAKLTGKSKGSCRYKAKILGLTYEGGQWKQWQVDILMEHYEKDGPVLCAQLTGKPKKSCEYKAYTLSLKYCNKKS